MDTGKPTGIDIKEKKLTLPLIHALQHVSSSDRRWMVNLVKNDNENSEALARVVEMVTKAGGIAHATQRMQEYRDQALAVLHTFPETEARRSLEGLVQLTVERTR
jgi:octaprenyl-diphosphate synthase